LRPRHLPTRADAGEGGQRIRLGHGIVKVLLAWQVVPVPQRVTANIRPPHKPLVRNLDGEVFMVAFF
jgi:hypothetical protein